VQLGGPKGRFALGRIAGLAADRQFDASQPDYDYVKLRFCTLDDLSAGELAKFLQEHAAAVAGAEPKKRRAAIAAGG
jgi:hypothetical protein